MADISAFQHKFRAVPLNGNGTRHENPARVQKRNRPVVSCIACRNRKSKCDRERPCSTCRSHDTTCSYKQAAKASARQTPQDRLSHLESLVVQIMTSKHVEDQKQIPILGKALTPPDDTPESREISMDDESQIADVPRGAFNTSDDAQSYVGPTHWQAILETINGLKNELSFVESNVNGEQPDSNEFKDSLFSTPCPPNLAYVLKQMPPRDVADRSLATYFNSRLFCVPIVHVEYFHRMYDQFWKSPTDMPILWVSSLFSMLSIAGLLVETIGSGKPQAGDGEGLREIYSRAAAQLLVLGNYVKPQRHLIEALFLYTQSKAMSSLDPAGETWILYGVISRQAIRLGYHRDPKHFPELSVFEGEIRRRAWFLLRQFDILLAFQAGLPCNFQDDDEWDTEPPRNILDQDFDESSTELPPARGDKDVTGMVYFLAKNNIMNLLKKLLHQQLSSKPLSYDEDVLQLDKELQDVYQNVPSILKMKPMSHSFTDPAWLIMNRFKIEILYLKSLCIIHRKYLTANPRHQFSIETCINAAMQILNHQVTIHAESQPSGQLYSNRWMIMSLHLADFFLAGVILGLIVTTVPCEKRDPTKAAEIQKLLRKSLDIISEQRIESAEAERFSSALEIILGRLHGEKNAKTNGTTVQSPDFSDKPADSALLYTSPSMTEGTALSLEINDFQGFFDRNENIDWTLIDNGLVMPNIHAQNFMSLSGDMNLPNGDFDSWLGQAI